MPVILGFLGYVVLTVVFAVIGQGAVAGVMTFAGVVILVIVLHEAGHFLTAKAFGIKVTEFFVGFGPRLWSRRRGDTEYGIKAIPAGGYVRIAGMNPLEEVPPEDMPRTFGAKPAWQRAIVLAAGSFMHFVLAFVFLFVFFASIGVLEAQPVVDSVVPKLESGTPTPASVAGFRPGDRLVSIDGVPVTSWEQSREIISKHPGESLTVVVERAGQRVTLHVTPAEQTEGGTTFGFIGIAPVERHERDGILPAMAHAFTGRDGHPGTIDDAPGIGDMVKSSFVSLGRIFGPDGLRRIGQLLTGSEQRQVTDAVGLVGAARLSGQAVQAGAFDALFIFFAFFNVFVGILNILPLPPLDGGHLAVLGIEKISGRKIDVRRLIPITAVVAGFLILFTVSLLYIDITSPLPNPFR